MTSIYLSRLLLLFWVAAASASIGPTAYFITSYFHGTNSSTTGARTCTTPISQKAQLLNYCFIEYNSTSSSKGIAVASFSYSVQSSSSNSVFYLKQTNYTDTACLSKNVKTVVVLQSNLQSCITAAGGVGANNIIYTYVRQSFIPSSPISGFTVSAFSTSQTCSTESLVTFFQVYGAGACVPATDANFLPISGSMSYICFGSSYTKTLYSDLACKMALSTNTISFSSAQVCSLPSSSSSSFPPDNTKLYQTFDCYSAQASSSSSYPLAFLSTTQFTDPACSVSTSITLNAVGICSVVFDNHYTAVSSRILTVTSDDISFYKIYNTFVDTFCNFPSFTAGTGTTSVLDVCTLTSASSSTYVLYSVNQGSVPPSVSFSGIASYGYEAPTACEAGTPLTTVTVNNLANYCLPNTGGLGSSKFSCTASNYSVIPYSDNSCLTLSTTKTVTHQFPTNCSINSNQTDNSNLYLTQSCYTAGPSIPTGYLSSFSFSDGNCSIPASQHITSLGACYKNLKFNSVRSAFSSYMNTISIMNGQFVVINTQYSDIYCKVFDSSSVLLNDTLGVCTPPNMPGIAFGSSVYGYTAGSHRPPASMSGFIYK